MVDGHDDTDNGCARRERDVLITIPTWHQATRSTARGSSYWITRRLTAGPANTVAVVNRAHDEVHPAAHADIPLREARRRGVRGAGGEVAVPGAVPLDVGREPDRGTDVLGFCMARAVKADA